MSPTKVTNQIAAVLHGPRDVRIEQRSVWPPQAHEAQVAVVQTGLCGSDLHYYAHGRNGDFVVQSPLVLGHEAAGVVTAVGSSVTHLVPGQRVALEVGIMCQDCKFCKLGRYNLCKNMRFCSSAKTFPHLDGTLQETMNHPAHILHPLPDNVSFEQGALIEPLAVLVHAARRANLSAGQTVLVFGVGAIGLLACSIAQSIGASRVVAIDINQARLDFAKREGFATDVYCLPAADKPKTTDEQLRRAKVSAHDALKAFGQADGFDVVFECTGAEPCIQMGIHGAAVGGRVMLVGMGAGNVTIPLATAAVREVDIQGTFRYANAYPEAIELLASGKLQNAEKLVTHRFSVQDAARAFELLSKGKDEEGNIVLKVMVGQQ